MSFNIGSLADFVNGDPRVVISDMVVGGQSFNILPFQEGIKGSTKVIDLADGGTNAQTGDYTGADEGFNGSVTPSDVTISVTDLWYKEKYSEQTINKKVLGLALRRGANPDDIVLSDAIMDIKGQSIRLDNEKLIWQGDVTLTGDTNLKFFDGIVKQLTTAGTYKPTGVAATGLTTSTAVASVQRMFDKMVELKPELIDKQTMLAMSPANFSIWYRTVYGLNSTITNQTLNTTGLPFSAQVPGTNITAYGFAGLVGSNEMILGRPENFVIGCDLKSDEEKMEFKYIDALLAYRLFVYYRLGVKVIRPSEVIREAVS